MNSPGLLLLRSGLVIVFTILGSEMRPAEHSSLKTPSFVKVGLLIPKESDEARRGAQLAVAHANRKGGFKGRSFQLIERSDEGPWGSGSKEIVKLVFEEKVWAILGPLDDRSAHLAEQIATKGGVVLVSPWATEPNLTQIKIPWFYRCVPDDRQQAEVLINEIFEKRCLERVGIITSEFYDSRVAGETFTRIATKKGFPPFLRLAYRSEYPRFDEILHDIQRHDIEGVVFFGKSLDAVHFLYELHAREMNQTLFGPLSLADHAVNLEESVSVSTGNWNSRERERFQCEYRKTYGSLPAPISAYAYDGMSIILQAIQKGGLDRQKIRDTLANIIYTKGVTGTIQFDKNGNRLGPFNLREFKKESPRSQL
jgi:branched-chain amino acid transport system substrate-binding protein